MILKIKSTKDDSFDSKDTGERINYYKVKGEKQDGTLITFGSKESHEDNIDTQVDLMIEARPDKNGKTRYYEVF